MKRCSVPAILFLLPLSLSSAQLGVNINFAERGGTFVDIVKEEYRWGAVGSGNDLSASQVDEFGWPKIDAQFVVDYRPVAEWSNSIDDPQVFRIDVSGTYKCSFVGSADVRGITGGSVRNTSYDAASNTTIFDFEVPGPPGANHGLIVLEFTKTKRTPAGAEGTGLTTFRMFRPGYDLSSTKTFTDEFIAALTGIAFSTIRFMNFSMTNGCDPDYPARTVWSKRKLTEDASQSRIPPLGKTDGAAWEYVIELCNLVKMDPWINIPISADSGYVIEVAKLFKANLDPGRNLYVESSNEVWNTAPGFEQSLYNQAEARALRIGEHANHARRTVELSKLFSQVFGPEALNQRLRVMLCSHQPMLKWWVTPMLDTIARAYGPPKDYLYAIACQTYFSGGSDAGESVAKVLADCRNDIEAQIDETGKTNEAGRKQWVKLAADRGLAGGYCSYEGGPDHGGGGTTNIANRIMAERDNEMGAVWTLNFDDAFFKAGGNLAMQFTLSSAYTRYGCWGLTEDITDPERNVKYKAAKLLADKYPATIASFRKGGAAMRQFSLYATATKSGIRVAYTLRQPGEVVVTLWNSRGDVVERRCVSYQAAGRNAVTFADTKRSPAGRFLIVAVAAGGHGERRGFVLAR
ncbi:MAG: hypothetical protein JXA71_06725 [Chitinispirillaceae bacterium]|nr:hypothetical protein [Chitinispirillaceae bacterium]